MAYTLQLTKDDRAKLFPVTGKLFPDGVLRLSRADDVDQVKSAVDCYGEYRSFFDPANSGLGVGGPQKSLEDKFFEVLTELLISA